MGIPERTGRLPVAGNGLCVPRPASLPQQPASSLTCCGRHNQGATLPGVPGVPGAPRHGPLRHA